jgi:hypothetical protein
MSRVLAGDVGVSLPVNHDQGAVGEECRGGDGAFESAVDLGGDLGERPAAVV